MIKKVDCALNHYYQDSEGSWGAFGCDGAWPPGLNLQKTENELIKELDLYVGYNYKLFFSAYMDWLVNNNHGKIQVKIFTQSTN